MRILSLSHQVIKNRLWTGLGRRSACPEALHSYFNKVRVCDEIFYGVVYLWLISCFLDDTLCWLTQLTIIDISNICNFYVLITKIKYKIRFYSYQHTYLFS